MIQYGEKLVLLAEASTSIISALPSIPPSAAEPYESAQSTAATRASVQYALDHYKPNSLSHSFQPSAADIERSDSRSFGVTHATELSNLPPLGSPPSGHVSLPGGLPAQGGAHVGAVSDSPGSHSSSPLVHGASFGAAGAHGSTAQSPLPVNTAALNNAPAQIPIASSKTDGTPGSTAATVAPLHITPQDDQGVSAPLPAAGPTVAETGVPVSAGAGGPGPASGSIHDLKASRSPSSATAPPSSYNAPSGAPPQWGAAVAGGTSGRGAVNSQGERPLESAEDEKKRLQREERERILQGTGGVTRYETADEEKKRLEREERDRLLSEGSSGSGGHQDGSGRGGDGAGGANPPPYQDF